MAYSGTSFGISFLLFYCICGRQKKTMNKSLIIHQLTRFLTLNGTNEKAVTG